MYALKQSQFGTSIPNSANGCPDPLIFPGESALRIALQTRDPQKDKPNVEKLVHVVIRL